MRSKTMRLSHHAHRGHNPLLRIAPLPTHSSGVLQYHIVRNATLHPSTASSAQADLLPLGEQRLDALCGSVCEVQRRAPQPRGGARCSACCCGEGCDAE